MTEQEAKQRWCPFSRTHVANEHGIVSVNVWPRDTADGRDRDYLGECRCIGSACMAWRSTPARRGRMSAIEEEIEMPAQSWCGLAGKP
jgi:hypothetical protein